MGRIGWGNPERPAAVRNRSSRSKNRFAHFHGVLSGDASCTILGFFLWRGRVWRPFPGSSPSAGRPVSQLPILAAPRFRNASLRCFADEPVPAPYPAQIRESVDPLRSICAAPSCATGLRPPALGGASQKNRRERSARPPPPRIAPTSCHASCCHRLPKDWQPLLSLQGTIGEASRWLL